MFPLKIETKKLSTTIFLGVGLQVLYYYIGYKIMWMYYKPVYQDYICLMLMGLVNSLFVYYKKDLWYILLIFVFWYLIFFHTDPSKPNGDDFSCLMIDLLHPLLPRYFGTISNMITWPIKYYCIITVMIVDMVYFYTIRITMNLIFKGRG